METLEILSIFFCIIGGSSIGAGIGNILIYLYEDKQFVKEEWKLFAIIPGIGIIFALIGIFI